MLPFSRAYFRMRSLLPYAALFGAMAFAAPACGDFGLSSLDTDDETYSGATGGYFGTGGAGGIDTGIGGTMQPKTFDYAGLCGRGCVLGEACEPAPEGRGGAGGDAGDGGAGGGGGSDGGGGAGTPGYGGEAPLACQLVFEVDSSQVESACAPVGTAEEKMPCLDSSDCAPGLGCVEPGECRRYCCDDLDGCDDRTFCAPRPLASGDLPDGSDAAPLIPVCAEVHDCVLLSDDCPEGQACTVVKADGTVSCVVPGEGQDDDPCPCADGYVCKPEINACLQLCRLDDPSGCPATAETTFTCQGGVNSYPDGFGVCVAN